MNENRQNVRYAEIGRVNSPELCALPGILDDISISGCRLHFPCIVSVDMDAEYKIKINLTRSPEDAPLQLLCKPRWVQDKEDSTEIGMMNLYSPDEVRLKEFIEYLGKLDMESYQDIL